VRPLDRIVETLRHDFQSKRYAAPELSRTRHCFGLWRGLITNIDCHVRDNVLQANRLLFLSKAILRCKRVAEIRRSFDIENQLVRVDLYCKGEWS
jgi:hypothetical protein